MGSVLLCYAHLWCCKIRYLPFLWFRRMTSSIIKRSDSNEKWGPGPNGHWLLSGLRGLRGWSLASDVDDWEGGTLVADLWVLFWVLKSRAVCISSAASKIPRRTFSVLLCSCLVTIFISWLATRCSSRQFALSKFMLWKFRIAGVNHRKSETIIIILVNESG